MQVFHRSDTLQSIPPPIFYLYNDVTVSNGRCWNSCWSYFLFGIYHQDCCYEEAPRGRAWPLRRMTLFFSGGPDFSFPVFWGIMFRKNKFFNSSSSSEDLSDRFAARSRCWLGGVTCPAAETELEDTTDLRQGSYGSIPVLTLTRFHFDTPHLQTYRPKLGVSESARKTRTEAISGLSITN